MRCDLCGRSMATKPFMLANGQSIGEMCSPECGALRWEAHLNQITDAPLHERALTAWQTRKRKAEVNGLPFTENPPKSPGERALEVAIATRGWTADAKGLE